MPIHFRICHQTFWPALCAVALLTVTSVGAPRQEDADGRVALEGNATDKQAKAKQAKVKFETAKSKSLLLRGASPVTVEVEVKPDDVARMRAAMEGRLPKATSIRLSLIDVVPPDGPDTTILVFLNHPAPVKASSRDAHLVGAVVFSHRENKKPQTFHLSLNRTLQRIPNQGRFASGKTVAVTLVAEPIRPSDDISNVRIPLRSVRVVAR